LAKQLLYLSNNQLSATIWEKGVFSEPQTFDQYPSGWLKFAQYLARHREIPAYLLTDLIEEDFQRETIPHVMGPARKNLIERRLLNLYRDTPYRQATQQGREKDGRRDDRMLFSALTNAQLLKPWLDALLKEKINVGGIYSVALLSPLLFKKLDLGKARALLVTHQSSGLRQNYFQDGYLRFSRLSPETAWSPEAIAEITDVEMAKTRQFLASTRLMARGEQINIVVVAAADIIAQLRPRCPNEGGMLYRFIDLDEARQVFGMTKLDQLTRCDPLFLSLLGSKRVPSHYATQEQTRQYRLSQLRAGLNALSVITLSAALIMATGNGLETMHATNQTHQAQIKTKATLAAYQATTSSMPVTVANPHDMKAAVEVAHQIAENGPMPTQVLSLLSRALEALPQIKIHELSWQTNVIEDAALDPSAAPAPAAPGEAPLLMGGLLGIPVKPGQSLILEGEVAPFKNDYRSALEIVQQLNVELQKDPHLRVEIIKPPIDIRPTVKLESQAGNDAELAKPLFSLKLVWKP
jgi:hypothetical protein